MRTTAVVSIQAGHLEGKVFWDRGLQSYVALLRLFDHLGTYPPPTKRLGHRPAEFITVDALCNHLTGCGLTPDSASLGAMQELAINVGDQEGRAEVAGLVDADGRRRLFVVTPSRLALPILPVIDHPAYDFQWGDNGPTTVETARSICERVFVRSPAQDIETFALALTLEYLCEVEGDFSFGADALCDWYLTDSPLSTELGPLELLTLRRRADVDGGVDC